MRKTILLSCENPQELSSLVGIQKWMDVSVVYFDVMGFYSSQEVVVPDSWKVVRARQVFAGRMSDLNGVKRVSNYILFSIQLFIIILFLRPSCILIGVPLIFFRLQRLFFFGGIKVISVLRSVIFKSSLDEGVGGFGRILSYLGFSGYSADMCLCVGESTARFARTQKFSEVIPVGPFDADGYFGKHPAFEYTYSGDPETIVFIEGAYAWHGDIQSENEQLNCLKDLKQFCFLNGKRLVFLRHPRGGSISFDGFGVEELHGGLAACLDLVQQYRGQVYFISMLSTMCFEMSYMGFPCCFYGTKPFLEKYEQWYSLQGNICFTDISDVDLSRSHINCGAVLCERYRGRVFQQAGKMVMDYLG